ncbi:hypothetical protein BKA82DRAFT_19004 [Pisolithus tinctorius]|uniref:Uncharacterized protein n=1 Tax=Pisolithus tinctorius Marx 270 TaxID=870435 RepID=A0A0C3PHP5_PISTI|nr:hypothetical protein BKA82DRAFT_19004 [Pisolithus tinctorius]KIO13570.1 hypothetical protein M404DRAFT_19004 [Pisolithus tinctorius Marx 270]
MNSGVAELALEQPYLEDHATVLVTSRRFSSETRSCDLHIRNSPTLLAPNSERSSCSSTKPSPTVRFAPLPKTESTRKRSIPPLGVSGRTRHSRISKEGRKPLWSIDPSSEEIGEDPIIVLGRFAKKAGIRLLQRVRRKSASQEKGGRHSNDVVDIKPDEVLKDTEPAVSPQETAGPKVGRRRRISIEESVMVD